MAGQVTDEAAPVKGATVAVPLKKTASPTTWLGTRLPYLQLDLRFWLSVFFGLAWAGFSTWLALPWIDDLGNSITLPLAIFVIGGIAIFPGYLSAFLFSSLLLDRPRDLEPEAVGPDRTTAWPDMTLLVATFDEEERIAETLDCALASDYPGRLDIVVADDGSTDRTCEIVRTASAAVHTPSRTITLMSFPHAGKARTLNRALEEISTEFFATIDADTLLSPQALRRATGRLETSTRETAAVAGGVMVRNSRRNWLTRLQEWDYQLGIAAIKRSQALWQATLVAQGAFSVYRTERVKEVGGWPDAIAEDIVMTWALIAAGYSISFEATAVAFTAVPERFRHLARQRSRWARGMIEGLKAHGRAIIARHRKSTHGVLIDLLFPWMDLCYTFAFLPGVILAFTGNFAIVGPITLAVIPINLMLSLLMFRLQRRSFSEVGLEVRRNKLGLLSYLVFYQPIMSPIALIGYSEEIFKRPHRW
jgi:biofilm PGA synthesis N-glycosyltransferase PgaC